MGFNPDGSPTNDANFQQGGGPNNTPQNGTGDHGEVWNSSGGPNGTGAWEQPSNMNSPTGGQVPGPRPGNGGNASGVNYNPRTGIADFGPDATTGNISDPTAWGGSSGAVVIGPDGKPMVDASQSGRGRDVSRLRDMGAGFDSRQAYQLDYSKGDQDRATAGRTRAEQNNAVALLGNAAKGGAPSAAVIQGQGGLDDAFSASLGQQASARSGPVAGAAAVQRGQAANASGSLGVANTLGQQRSAELMGDRAAYSGSAGAMRGGDLQGQALDQQRAKAKYESEIGQRKLNDRGQREAEDLAYDVNKNAMNAGLKNDDLNAGNIATSLQRETQNQDRLAKFYNTAIDSAGDLAKKA